jgi:hypothetical protein
MAVDTRDKRASVLGLGLAALLVLPQPGTLDQGDRQQTAYSYRGIEADEAVVIEGDLVTAANAYFRRTVAGEDAGFRRAATVSDGAFRRSVTTADTER